MSFSDGWSIIKRYEYDEDGNMIKETSEWTENGEDNVMFKTESYYTYGILE